jgi:hypothetical protein
MSQVNKSTIARPIPVNQQQGGVTPRSSPSQ